MCPFKWNTAFYCRKHKLQWNQSRFDTLWQTKHFPHGADTVSLTSLNINLTHKTWLVDENILSGPTKMLIQQHVLLVYITLCSLTSNVNNKTEAKPELLKNQGKMKKPFNETSVYLGVYSSNHYNLFMCCSGAIVLMKFRWNAKSWPLMGFSFSSPKQ